MSGTQPDILTRSELIELVQQVEPTTLLIPARILRRVIKLDRKLGGFGLQIPHQDCYSISRTALLALADEDELRLAPGQQLADKVVLFAEPDDIQLETQPAPTILRHYWRLLFHARVHQVIEERHLDTAAVACRVAALGSTEFAEIQAVLQQDGRLLPPVDPRSVYEEFVSLYLELHYFAPELLPIYFPGIRDFQKVDRIIAQDIQAEDLRLQTHLRGAAEPEAIEERQDEQHWWFRLQVSRADGAHHKGNLVRAAILRFRASRSATPSQASVTTDQGHAEIEALADRVQQALHLDEADAERWRQRLPLLLEPASSGAWPVEARLLYDLQKICVDQERNIYAIDVARWIFSGFRKPLKRQVPNQRLVLAVRHLRSAQHNLTTARLPEDHRLELNELLDRAIIQAEKELRDQLRPGIAAALQEVGLSPKSYVETLERDKLVEELLDRAVDTGYLNMGDLRDAIARNRLKLNDLSSPLELLGGDPLIRANRKLAKVADGVYRGGEVYLRGLQSFSSIFFGTRIGRLLTLYLIVPFLGAYMVLEGFQHAIVDPIHYLVSPQAIPRHIRIASAFGHGADPQGAIFNVMASSVALRSHVPHITTRWSVLGSALLVAGLLYLPFFRNLMLRMLQLLWRILRYPFYDLPIAFFSLPWVVRFLDSPLYLFLTYYLIRPLLWTTPFFLFAYCLFAYFPDKMQEYKTTLIGLGFLWFVTVTLLLNSRLGRRLQEMAADTLARSWHMLGANLIPDLFRLILYFFKWLLERMEKLIYTVDEWLRFRQGESNLALAVKGVLGLLWSAITYVIRFIVVLLVEPQINPIKHFPVVTVSHKLVATLGVPPAAHLLEQYFSMNTPDAFGLAFLIGGCIPGIFGFLAWELKENWRLYRANEPTDLQPLVVGHHGETMARLMRPGFHSGTLPRLYARWRYNLGRGKGTSAHKQEEALHHLLESLEHFLDRNFLCLLHGSKTWGPDLKIHIASLHPATNRIRIDLRCPQVDPEPFLLDFEEENNQLVAGIQQAGWIDRLNRPRRKAFLDALVGLYKLSGVDRVREAGLEKPIHSVPIVWKEWEQLWELDQKGLGHEQPLIKGIRLFPETRNPLPNSGIFNGLPPTDAVQPPPSGPNDGRP